MGLQSAETHLDLHTAFFFFSFFLFSLVGCSFTFYVKPNIRLLPWYEFWGSPNISYAISLSHACGVVLIFFVFVWRARGCLWKGLEEEGASAALIDWYWMWWIACTWVGRSTRARGLTCQKGVLGSIRRLPCFCRVACPLDLGLLIMHPPLFLCFFGSGHPLLSFICLLLIHVCSLGVFLASPPGW